MATEGEKGISTCENGFAGLTPIHQRIHCAATPDTTQPEDELENIAIDNFLNILAEVALAAARRR